QDIGGSAYNLARGAVMGPLSDVAGLAAIPLHAAGAIDTPPIDVKSKVAHAGEYTPQTDTGRALEKYNPFALVGRGVEAVAGGAGRAVERSMPNYPIAGSMLGYGVKGAIEQAPMLAGAALGKGAAARTAAKQETLDVAKGENSVKDATRDAAQAAGYKTPPEHGLKAAVSGLVGKTRAEKALSEHNEVNATRRLGAEVGAPDGAALSEEEFDRLKENTGRFYDEVPKALGPSVTVTTQFDQALRGTLSRLDSMTDQEGLGGPKRVIRAFLKKTERPTEAPPAKAGPSIMKTIQEASKQQPGPAIGQTIERAATDSPNNVLLMSRESGGRPLMGDVKTPRLGVSEFGIKAPPSFDVPTAHQPTLSTKQVMSDIQQLRKQAKADFARKDNELGTTRLGIANQLEDLIESNLTRTGKQGLLEAYRAARERFAKIYLLERITNDATGRVSLQKLASLSDSPAYKRMLTGEFKTAADFAKTFRKGAQRSTGEAIPRLTVFDGLFGIGALFAGHPGYAAAELAARLGIPYAAERGLLQNRTPSYIGRPPLTGKAPPLGLLTQGATDQIASPPL
ncbi:MAG TPA: hypothetical protein VKV24_14580, partial [Casimicrobiaceae bacterium]|nr:hypothetical protein [Casimicrobiaceae bacterium]